MKPRSSFQKRFILAESDGLIIETIQTYNRDCPRRGSPKMETKGAIPKQELRLLKLKGTWHANNYNELVFEASGRKGRRQIYTFKGAWKINSNQQIEYITEDGRDTLTFKGHWQIPSAKKLVYSLEGSSKSRFEFKAHIESASMRHKKGEIRYRIGIGVRRLSKTLPNQIFMLYGEWKFSRNLGLLFEIDYGEGRVQSIKFGGELTFQRDKISIELISEIGKPLGISLTLNHRLIKVLDAQAFIRLSKLCKDVGVEAGITVPF